MQPLLPYLLGAEHPAGARLGDVQPCLRAQDMGDVGDNRHTTFFEMLGNWSLGDYSKSVQIPMLWQFLTDRVGLPPGADLRQLLHRRPRARHPARRESARDLDRPVPGGRNQPRPRRPRHRGARQRGRQPGRPDRLLRPQELVEPLRRARTRCRSATRAAPTPRSSSTSRRCRTTPAFGRYPHQNSDGGQYLEIGNSVFMQYRRTADGFAELPHHNVDFGGGLERIAAASIDSPDVYRIDLLWPIVEALESLSGRTYERRPRRCGWSPTTCAARRCSRRTGCGPATRRSRT